MWAFYVNNLLSFSIQQVDVLSASFTFSIIIFSETLVWEFLYLLAAVCSFSLVQCKLLICFEMVEAVFLRCWTGQWILRQLLHQFYSWCIRKGLASSPIDILQNDFNNSPGKVFLSFFLSQSKFLCDFHCPRTEL